MVSFYHKKFPINASVEFFNTKYNLLLLVLCFALGLIECSRQTKVFVCLQYSIFWGVRAFH